MTQEGKKGRWKLAEVRSPISRPVPVIAAKDLPYFEERNHLQALSIYLPRTQETSALVGQPVTHLPFLNPTSKVPRWQVHIHGGAWRDPQLTASSIEATVANAFSAVTETIEASIAGIASLNYTLTKFPTHPTLPYDPEDNHADPSREAVHPTHVRDVLLGFALLHSLGLVGGSYVLTGHSAGSCLAFQATLPSPRHWGFKSLPNPPRPAAVIGMNGLYDLPNLVHGLGTSHEHLSEVYTTLLTNAFGPEDQSDWVAASPARLSVDDIAERVREGKGPRLVMLDQSAEDQLVPMNQTENMEAHLRKIQGLTVVRSHNCTGSHASPWEQGTMIWKCVQDVLQLLKEGS